MQFAVHRFHYFPTLDAGGDIGLVSDDDDQEAGLAQRMDRTFYPREKLELCQHGGRVWLAITYYCTIDSAITIEEDRPLHIIRVADSEKAILTTWWRFVAGQGEILGNARLLLEMPRCGE